MVIRTIRGRSPSIVCVARGGGLVVATVASCVLISRILPIGHVAEV